MSQTPQSPKPVEITTWNKLWSRPDADKRLGLQKSIHPNGRSDAHRAKNRRKRHVAQS